ncbi:hypothetical protein DFH06DRAFT_1319201 [Mycena polygramma]|nr:hypothetical protein DFH06DRAFT_1319201 [Mycena polygramma]
MPDLPRELGSGVATVSRPPAGASVDVAELGVSRARPLVVDLTDGHASIQSAQQNEDANLILVDDSIPFTTTATKFSDYQFIDGVLQDYCNSPPVDVVKFNTPTLGGKFKIYLGNFSIPGQPDIAIAIKYPIGLEEDTVAIWTEWARVADLNSHWESFERAALAQNQLIPNVGTIAISLLTEAESGRCAIGQPWQFGERFTMDSVSAYPNGDGVWATLSAFSHYTYQASNQSRVYIDFEGVFTPFGGFRILDSRTHLVDAASNHSGRYFIGGLGQEGVQKFIDTHNCNALCGALLLNHLPVLFPLPPPPPITLTDNSMA